MMTWLKYAKDNITNILLLVLICAVTFSVVQGCTNGRAITDVSEQRDAYFNTSGELMDGLQESQELIRQSLVTVGRIERVYSELKITVDEIGVATQGVGDESIGIGITSDENVRIIRELRSRLVEDEE